MKRFVALSLIFAFGVFLGFAVWNSVTLPYHNPHNTFGILAKLRFNPNNNVLRYIVFLAMPSALLALVALTYRRSRSWLMRPSTETPLIDHSPHFNSNNRLCVILMMLILVVASHFRHLENTKAAVEPPRIDHFHNGEALAAATAWEHGLIPYRDFYVARGMFQDPGKVMTAFKIFSFRSQSSVRTFETIQVAVSYLALGGLLLLLFSGNYLASLLLATCFCLYQAIGFLTPSRLWDRDIVCILFLAALLIILRRAPRAPSESASRNGLVYLSAFTLCFLSPAGFAYALDRGYFITAVLLIVWPLLYFVVLHRSPIRKPFAFASLIGFGAGFLVLGVAVKWAYADLFRYAFLQIPSYKEFVDGTEFAINSSNFRASGYRAYILTMHALSVFWLMYELIQMIYRGTKGFWNSVAEFIRKYLFEIAFVLMAIVVFRYALGRADREHIATAGTYHLLFLTYIAVRYYLPRFIERVALKRVLVVGMFAILFGVLGINTYWFVTRNVVSHAYPLGLTDKEMLTEDYLQAIEFLKPRISEQAQFVTLTNEGSWYYLLDQPSPLIFAEIWFGSSDFFDREMAEQLRSKPVMYVLYSNDAVWNAIDSMATRDRNPQIFEYVEQNFSPFIRIGSHDIWVRNGFSPPAPEDAPQSFSASILPLNSAAFLKSH